LFGRGGTPNDAALDDDVAAALAAVVLSVYGAGPDVAWGPAFNDKTTRTRVGLLRIRDAADRLLNHQP
jgi:hypothetical protein